MQCYHFQPTSFLYLVNIFKLISSSFNYFFPSLNMFLQASHPLWILSSSIYPNMYSLSWWRLTCRIRLLEAGVLREGYTSLSSPPSPPPSPPSPLPSPSPLPPSFPFPPSSSPLPCSSQRTNLPLCYLPVFFRYLHVSQKCGVHLTRRGHEDISFFFFVFLQFICFQASMQFKRERWLNVPGEPLSQFYKLKKFHIHFLLYLFNLKKRRDYCLHYYWLENMSISTLIIKIFFYYFSFFSLFFVIPLKMYYYSEDHGRTTGDLLYHFCPRGLNSKRGPKQLLPFPLS